MKNVRSTLGPKAYWVGSIAGIILIWIILLLSVHPSISAAQEWRALPSAPSLGQSKKDDIYFVDSDKGWGISPIAIYHTDDGGATWPRQFKAPAFSILRAIGFANDQVGWVGDLRNPWLYHTTNGGRSWVVVQLPDDQVGVCGLFVIDEMTIYGVGVYHGPAHFIKSTDGGVTWSVVDLSPLAGGGVDIHFWNKYEGVLLGGVLEGGRPRVVILATSDGGTTWEKRFEGSRAGEWGWKFSFPTQDIGYASIQTQPGSDAPETEYFLKTVDGGQTWEEKPFWTQSGSQNYSAQGIGFVTPDVGWIGSWRSNMPTLATTDGGETWSETDFGRRLNRFRFLSDTLGYASGSTFFKYSKAVATSLEGSDDISGAFRVSEVYPNPARFSLTVEVTLTNASQTRIDIYDLVGRKIDTLEPGMLTSGQHRINIDVSRYSSGLYFLRLSAGSHRETRKMVVVN